MVAFACNRRQNTLQLHNSLNAVTFGVSNIVNEYPNIIWLASYGNMAAWAFDNSQAQAEFTINNGISWDHIIQPFICAENLDFQTPVHHKQVEKFTRLFHGSWGYFHFIPDQITRQVLQEAWTQFPQMNEWWCFTIGQLDQFTCNYF